MMTNEPSVGVIVLIIRQVCLVLCVCIGYRTSSNIEIATTLLHNIRKRMRMTAEKDGMVVRVDDRMQGIIIRKRIIVAPSTWIGVRHSILQRFMDEDKGCHTFCLICIQQR